MLTNDSYKAELEGKLRETEGRTTFSAEEVRDMLLDMWNALDRDRRNELVSTSS